MDNPILGLLITLLLVLANAFFVAAEFAIVKVRASQIELRAQSGGQTARMAQHLISHLDAYLSATQLGITLASLGLGWIGEPIVAQLVLGGLNLFGIAFDPALAHKIALPIAFVLITFLHIVFGELAPKSLAIQHPEPTTLAVAFPLRFFFLLLFPAIAALNWVANQVLRMVGIEPASESAHYHSGEELRLLIERGREEGTIRETEHELIENVFEFSDTIVREVMVPRTNIVALDVAASPNELLRVAVEEGYTRMPVYEGSLDNIVGVVHSKDLIALLEHRDLIILHDLLRPVHFIPESKRISQLLREFQRRKIHMAIVIDEFGSTTGLVTMEDILEELVGEIQDEHDEELLGVEKTGEGTYVVNAAMTIADANELMPSCQLPEGESYTTISGLVNKWFERIPEVNESVERDSIRMTVLKTDSHRVVQVKIEDMHHQENG
jgi:CBS domain containing-hemolysin-like protein